MLRNTNFGRIVVTVVVLMMLLLLLPVASEMNPLRLTTVFGQNPHLSNQLPSSSLLSSFVSAIRYQKNNFNALDYSLSPSTGINDGNGASSNGYSGNTNKNNNNSKLVILNFDDGFQNQYTYAKPILDSYGFKASFFVVCNYAGKPDRMSWQEITALYHEGYDVESHSMNHNHMNQMTPDELNYEIGQSKQCLADHGINATIFAYPFDIGWDDPTIVNIVSKYYNLARTGNAPLAFLHCDGYKNDPQTDCRTYTDNGQLTFANRYSVRSWTHDTVAIKDGFDDSETYNKFIEEVNSQNAYNNDNNNNNNGGDGNDNTNNKINAIPLISYHNVDYLTGAYHTNVDLFAKEMKYLHDMGLEY